MSSIHRSRNRLAKEVDDIARPGQTPIKDELTGALAPGAREKGRPNLVGRKVPVQRASQTVVHYATQQIAVRPGNCSHRQLVLFIRVLLDNVEHIASDEDANA